MPQRCTNCNINYDAGRYCKRCGRLLVETNSPNHRTISKTIVVIIITFLSIGLIVSYCLGKFIYERASYKEANRFETSYCAIAEDLDLADLCYKISPNAVRYDWFTPTYERSSCLYTVAIQTHSVNLCKQVKSTTFYGSAITQANCEVKAAQPGDHHYSHTDFNTELILKSLGYNDEDVMKHKPISQVKNSYFSLYLVEQKKPEFRARLATLPDFSVSDENAMRQIYTMVPECIKRPVDNPWCLQIDNGLIRR